MNKIAVIAVAYNRPRSLSRLLASLDGAYYNNNSVDLIISIDKSEIEDEIIGIANDFNWEYGNKRIRTFNKRQGLREHILQCGDLVQDYEAVIIFEDDIIPAKNYFLFAKEALNYYCNDERIAGISLYTPQKNVMTGKQFVPMQIDSDVFFMQVAQSWGQCWSRNMWYSFREWYEGNKEELPQEDDIPRKVLNWPKSSWLKYFMRYVVRSNKYFVYPYISLSSNSTDVGEHNKLSSNAFQVPLLYGYKEYKFIPVDKGIKYDIFFERQELSNVLNEIDDENLCVDLYGSKISNSNKRFILTRKKMDYEIIHSFGLRMRPHEANILYEVKGEDIFLYDLKERKEINLIGKRDLTTEIKYYNSGIWKEAIIYGFLGFKDAVYFKFRKKFRKK